MAFHEKPHIFWSTASFSIIFSAGESWMHALSTQASEKGVWLFSLLRIWSISCYSRYCINLQRLACLHFIYILLLGCILIVSKIDLTWPNQPGPCGTLWSSHYNNISDIVYIAGRRVIWSWPFGVFTMPRAGRLVSIPWYSIAAFHIYAILYRQHNFSCYTLPVTKLEVAACPWT